MLNFEKFLNTVSEHLLLWSCLILLTSSIILSFKTRFVQFRMLPQMFKIVFSSVINRKEAEGKETIHAHKALFTAMSTTIGISTIVSPVIAIHLGGPGALVGFFLTTIFGSAANFTEVTLALSFRKKLDNGTIKGGPMQYLNDGIHPFLAKWYAFFCFVLMVAWSSAQANQLADILNSQLLGSYQVPSSVTGIVLACLVICVLFGGIKRIGKLSEKLVPLMFMLYVMAALWIVFSNLTLLPAIFSMIFESLHSPQSFASGAVVGGLASAMRWGVFKGVQSSEAGIGTPTIPHSMAQTQTPINQGILSMASTYSSGFICLLSGIVTLMTDTWQNDSLKLGINMVAESFAMYFSYVGILIVIVSAFLFAFGTIIGNSYNGSQCFGFLTHNRFINGYYLFTAAIIFLGSISDVKIVWTIIDFCLVPVAIPHIVGIVYLAFKRGDLLKV
jgi:alanine or glycine:cation symporter, AGCS family